MIKGTEQLLYKEQQSGTVLFTPLKDGQGYDGVKNDWNMVGV